MKVKELLALLSEMDQELPVYLRYFDSSFSDANGGIYQYSELSEAFVNSNKRTHRTAEARLEPAVVVLTV